MGSVVPRSVSRQPQTRQDCRGPEPQSTRSQKCLVPKGHPRIAQRFSVGIAGNSEPMSPEGSTETRCDFSRPFGTEMMLNGRHPTLKRWAILTRPFGTGRTGERASSMPPGVRAPEKSEMRTANSVSLELNRYKCRPASSWCPDTKPK